MEEKIVHSYNNGTFFAFLYLTLMMLEDIKKDLSKK